MKKLTLACLALLLTACADSTHFVKRGDQGSFAQRSTFYVALPEDGLYGSKVYQNSGRMTANHIRQALLANGQKAIAANRREDLDAALVSAQQKGADYLAYSVILHWEDRATEWNFMSDEVRVELELIDVFSGEVQAQTMIEGRSGNATLGGDHPQDLLPEPLNKYFQQLFAR